MKLFFFLLLLCFVSGFTQAVLLCVSVFILKHHRTYLFQRIFAYVLIMHSLGFFNNFLVATCWNLPYSEYLNSLLIFYDYMIVGGYMMFSVSLIFPNRYSFRQLSLLEIPFVTALVLFAVTGSPVVYPAIQIFTLTASTVLLVYLEYSIKKHTAMLQDNVGNLEYFDLRWSSIILIVLFVVQLLWAIESLSQLTWFSVSVTDRNLLFDTCYCFLALAFVVFVKRKIILQQVFVINPEKNEPEEPETSVEKDLATDTHDSYHKVLLLNNIEEVIRKKNIIWKQI